MHFRSFHNKINFKPLLPVLPTSFKIIHVFHLYPVDFFSLIPHFTKNPFFQSHVMGKLPSYLNFKML